MNSKTTTGRMNDIGRGRESANTLMDIIYMSTERARDGTMIVIKSPRRWWREGWSVKAPGVALTAVGTNHRG